MAIQFKHYNSKKEQTKTVTITQNGTTEVTPDSGKVLSKVTATVNVPTMTASVSGTTLVLTGNVSVSGNTLNI